MLFLKYRTTPSAAIPACISHQLDALTLPKNAGPPEGTSSIFGSVQSAGDGACRRQLALDLGLVIMMLVSAAGCSSMGGVEPLEVTLSNIQIPEVTVFETTLVARLRITNPNPEAFTIDGASFKLYLEDKKVGTGTTAETFTVDRLDSTVVDAVFHINNVSALLRLKDIFAGDKEISYGIRGSLFTQGNFGTKKIKVEKMGRIDLSEMQSLDTDGPDLLNSPPPSG